MQIGVIADTHDELVPWDEVLAKVTAAFEGVDLVLHCGDLTTLRALDDLGGLAPVVAVRSAGDPPADDVLLEGPYVLEAGGVTIGLVSTLGDAAAATSFDRPVDVVVHGGTHVASVETTDGVLYVNPGSPSLADQTTVARLVVGDGPPSASIVAI